MRDPSDALHSARSAFVRDALISYCAVLMVVAAFDDIATDNANDFAVEYWALVVCSVWFANVALKLTRAGHRTLGILSFAVLAAAAWGQHAFDRNISPGRSLAYLTTVGAIFWFVALATWLLWLGWRAIRHSGRR